jgi:hypothetical protein
VLKFIVEILDKKERASFFETRKSNPHFETKDEEMILLIEMSWERVKLMKESEKIFEKRKLCPVDGERYEGETEGGIGPREILS